MTGPGAGVMNPGAGVTSPGAGVTSPGAGATSQVSHLEVLVHRATVHPLLVAGHEVNLPHARPGTCWAASWPGGGQYHPPLLLAILLTTGAVASRHCLLSLALAHQSHPSPPPAHLSLLLAVLLPHSRRTMNSFHALHTRSQYPSLGG